MICGASARKVSNSLNHQMIWILGVVCFWPILVCKPGNFALLAYWLCTSMKPVASVWEEEPMSLFHCWRTHNQVVICPLLSWFTSTHVLAIISYSCNSWFSAFKLSCRLHGNVESMAVLSSGGGNGSRSRDSLILAFQDAKISILEFDDSMHGLRTT